MRAGSVAALPLSLVRRSPRKVMSEAEIQVVLGAAAAYNERGSEAVIEFLDPEIEWRTRSDLPDSGTYRGQDGFRHLISRFEEVMDDIYMEAGDVIDAGERVIVRLRWGGRGKASGAEFEENEETWVLAVRGGKIVRVDEYATKEEALEAAGIEA